MNSLKVSKFQNEFMKSLFPPKYEPNIVRISALYCGRIDDFKNLFWNSLTFSKEILIIQPSYPHPEKGFWGCHLFFWFELEKNIQPWTFPGLDPNIFYGWRKYSCTKPAKYGYQTWKRVKLQNLTFFKSCKQTVNSKIRIERSDYQLNYNATL